MITGRIPFISMSRASLHMTGGNEEAEFRHGRAARGGPQIAVEDLRADDAVQMDGDILAAGMKCGRILLLTALP
jgi:hypothetical protein